MFFASDNAAPVHPSVIEALARINHGHARGYGADEIMARVTARIDLAIAGKTLELSLPEVELEPTSYRGERGVEVRLPLINRRF